MFIYQQQHLENLSTPSVNEKLVPKSDRDSYCLVVISVAASTGCAVEEKGAAVKSFLTQGT
jgi:hypothetical protein